MLKGFFQLYKIGKELGLSKKEINKIFLFDNRKDPLLLKILLVIFIFSFLGIFVLIILNTFSEYIYPTGALYSTVKIEDFKAKNKR